MIQFAVAQVRRSAPLLAAAALFAAARVAFQFEELLRRVFMGLMQFWKLILIDGAGNHIGGALGSERLDIGLPRGLDLRALRNFGNRDIPPMPARIGRAQWIGINHNDIRLGCVPRLCEGRI